MRIADARAVRRSFRGGYPSAVSKVRIQSVSTTPTIAAGQTKIVRDGEYNSKEDVSSYMRQFKGVLPRNFITKFKEVNEEGQRIQETEFRCLPI